MININKTKIFKQILAPWNRSLKKMFQGILTSWNLLSKKRRAFILSSIVVIVFVLATPLFASANVIAAGIAKILLGLLRAIAGIFQWIIKIEMSLFISFIQFNNFTTGVTAVEEGWKITRDICNMFFILVLLVIAFSTILNYEAYSYKKWLSKIIIAAVLINFSKTIVGLMIDFSQVIMLTFVNAFKDIAMGNIINGLHLDSVFQVSYGEISEVEGTDEYKVALNLVVIAALAVSMLAILSAVLAMFIVMIVWRIVYLWVLVILSPLAFFLQATPFGSKYSAKWWTELGRQLTTGPVLAFFLYLALLTIQKANGGNIMQGMTESKNLEVATTTLQSTVEQVQSGDTQAQADANVAKGIGNMSNIFDFVVVIALLMTAMRITQESGVAGSKIAGNLTNKMGNLAKKGARTVSGYNAVSDRIKAYSKIRSAKRQERVNRDAIRFGAGMAKVEGTVRGIPRGIGKGVVKMRDYGKEKQKISTTPWGAGTGATLNVIGTGLAGLGTALGYLSGKPIKAFAEKRAQKNAMKASVLENYKISGMNPQDYLVGVREDYAKSAKKVSASKSKIQKLESNLQKNVDENGEQLGDDDRIVMINELRKEKANLKEAEQDFKTKDQRFDAFNEFYEGEGNVVRDVDFGSLKEVSPEIINGLREEKQLLDRFAESSFGSLEEFINQLGTEDPLASRGTTLKMKFASIGKEPDKDNINESYKEALRGKDGKDPMGSGKIWDDINDHDKYVNQNKNRMDVSINRFRSKEAAWNNVGYGASITVDPLLSLASKLAVAAAITPIAAPLGMSSFAGYGTAFGADIVKGQGKRSDEMISGANSASHEQIMDSKKQQFDSLSMGQVKGIVQNDATLSDTDKIAARLALMEKGGVKSNEVDKYRSDLQLLGADKFTMNAYEKSVADKYQSQAIVRDASGKVLTDGDRDAALKSGMSWNGAGKTLQNASPSGMDAELLKAVINSAQSSGHLKSIIGGTNDMQKDAINEQVGRMIVSRLGNMTELMKMNEATQERELKFTQKLIEVYSHTSKQGVDGHGVMKAITKASDSKDAGVPGFFEENISKSSSISQVFNFANMKDESVQKYIANLDPRTFLNGMNALLDSQNEDQKKMLNDILRNRDIKLSPEIERALSKLKNNSRLSSNYDLDRFKKPGEESEEESEEESQQKANKSKKKKKQK